MTATLRYALNGYALVSAVTSRVAVPTFTKVETSFLTTRSAQRALSAAGFRQSEFHGRLSGPATFWDVLRQDQCLPCSGGLSPGTTSGLTATSPGIWLTTSCLSVAG